MIRLRNYRLRSITSHKNDIAKFLINYIKKGNPATIHTATRSYQCHNRRDRSIDDLLLLYNHYADTPIARNTLIAALPEVAKEVNFILGYCNTIGKVVIASFGSYNWFDRKGWDRVAGVKISRYRNDIMDKYSDMLGEVN